MKLSAQRSLLPGADLSERFQRAAECGLDGIELAVGRTARVYELHAEIDKAMVASGLPVGSICVVAGIAHNNSIQWQRIDHAAKISLHRRRQD